MRTEGNMKLSARKVMAAGIFCLTACLLTGCGCGKAKEKDAMTEEVMKITITPEPTATPVPEQVNPDAVVTNGNVTMVNEYLLQEGQDGEE